MGLATYCQGNICAYRGQMGEANALFRKAIVLDPYCARAYENLALMLNTGNRRDREEAGTLIVQAHRIAVEDTIIAQQAAAILTELGRPAEALEALRETMAKWPVDSPERKELERSATGLKWRMER